MSLSVPLKYAKIDMGGTVIIDSYLKDLIKLLSNNISWFNNVNILTQICEYFGDNHDALQLIYTRSEKIDPETICKIIKTSPDEIIKMFGPIEDVEQSIKLYVQSNPKPIIVENLPFPIDANALEQLIYKLRSVIDDLFYNGLNDELTKEDVCECIRKNSISVSIKPYPLKTIDPETILQIIQTLSNHIELLKDKRTLYIILYGLKIEVIKGVEFDFALNAIEKLRDEYNFFIPDDFIKPQTEIEFLESLNKAHRSESLINVMLIDKPTLKNEKVTEFRDSILSDMNLNQNSVNLNYYTEITHSILSIVHQMWMAFHHKIRR